MKPHFYFKIFFLSSFFFLASVYIRAEEKHHNRYGAYAHYLIGSSRADFPYLPGTQSCCAKFERGTGNGIAVGLLADIPFSESLSLGLRASFVSQSFSLIQEEYTRVIVDGIGQDGAFEHILEGSLSSFGAEPVINYSVFEKLGLHAGVRISFPLASSYIQEDRISKPDGVGTFLNPDGTDSERRVRNEYSGALPDLSLQIAPLVGISYELPLNKKGTLFLAPEVFYQFGLTDVVTGTAWKMHTLRLGASVRYSGAAKPEVEEIRHKTDTVTVPVSIVTAPYAKGSERTAVTREENESLAKIITTISRTDTLFTQIRFSSPITESEPEISVSVCGVDSSGNEIQSPVLRIEEFISTTMTPLLGYIFFDSASSAIGGKYHLLDSKETMSFDMEKINSPEKLPTYYHILNIVGKRMRDYPASSIRLTGCTDNIERGGSALAGARAAALKNYLTSAWNIDPARIITESRLLPQKASKSSNEDGYEENRRVEITSETYEVLAPLISSDTLRVANPGILRIKPKTGTAMEMEAWSISIEQKKSQLKKFEGTAPMPQYMDWKINWEKSVIPRSEDMVSCLFYAEYVDGTDASASASIRVEQETIVKKRALRIRDKEIDRYSLILFEVGSAEIIGANARIIDYIVSQVKAGSSVSVTGYTDRLGDPEENDKLAASRAANTASAIGRNIIDKTSSAGNTDLYDNELPEGRFYSRTVEITVETPVE